MKVFVTGASGWVGSAVASELTTAGHEVIGLVRTEQSAAALERIGGTALRGDLDDLDSLRRGADEADAVVHLANKHDWANPGLMNLAERNAVQRIGQTLADTGRPFLIASAVAGVAAEGIAMEADASPAIGLNSMRGGSENLALSFAEQGVRAMAARFAPSVHGMGDSRGFVASLVAAARSRGVSGFIGDGSNSWCAVHRDDTATLVRLAIENASSGARVHAVAEQSITTKAIAEAIGARYALPVVSVGADDAMAHFGPVSRFFASNIEASSAYTQELLGWRPSSPSLLQDIAAGAYDGA